MEAGNRCYDDRVPEEVNRRVIDHSSDVLMPYTERSRANLLREGIASNRIFVTGNPILEVIEHYRDRIEASDALTRLGRRTGKILPRHHAPRRKRGPRTAAPRAHHRARRTPRRIRHAHYLQPASPHAEQNAGLRAERRERANPLHGTAGLLRLHRLGKAGLLRLKRQRHGAGGMLPLPRAERHDPRRDRTAGDGRMRQQHARRAPIRR